MFPFELGLPSRTVFPPYEYVYASGLDFNAKLWGLEAGAWKAVAPSKARKRREAAAIFMAAKEKSDEQGREMNERAVTVKPVCRLWKIVRGGSRSTLGSTSLTLLEVSLSTD
jgi:hypothetical protein